MNILKFKAEIDIKLIKHYNYTNNSINVSYSQYFIFIINFRNSSTTSKKHVHTYLYGEEGQFCECSEIPFPSMAGSSTPSTTCNAKESVDMDSSAEQITSAGFMAMFGKTPAPSKDISHCKRQIFEKDHFDSGLSLLLSNISCIAFYFRKPTCSKHQ